MKMLTDNLEPLGFKGNNMLVSKCHNYYYATHVTKEGVNQIIVVDNLNEAIYHFNLSKKEMKMFNQNKFSVVPIGCCGGLWGNPYTEDRIIDFKGDFKETFKTRKNVLVFIASLMDK